MSGTAPALLCQLTGVSEQYFQVLGQEQKELKQQKEAFVREKKLMQTVAVADNDIVNLSVGGTLMSTKRSTLTQGNGLLAAMFSGCYEDNLDHDSEGRVFLDFDPQLFQSILSSLRCCNIRDSATPVPLQKVDNSKLAAYLDLVKYLGLEECMGYHTHKPNLVQAERFYCISQEGQHAKLQNSSYKERSLTLEKIVTDVGYMKFTWRPRRMHGHENQLSVGVADLSHVKNGCAPFCGWQIEGTSLSADGVWIIIKADMRTGKLTMLELNSSPRHKCFSASSWGKCVFQVAMNIDESEIELFPVTAEDQHMFL